MRSGWQVLISTTFTQMLASILAPWIKYQVFQWQRQYSGIEFPPDYDQQVQQLVVMSWTIGVGILHMAALKLPAVLAWWSARRDSSK